MSLADASRGPHPPPSNHLHSNLSTHVAPISGTSSQAIALRRNDPVAAPVWWTMLACSVVAIIGSSYLAWASFTSSPVAGCGSGNLFDCDHVLHSRFSTVLSFPVSVPAIMAHLAVIGMLFFRPGSERGNRQRWATIGLVALAIGGAAFWFVGLQLLVLQHLCPYCLVVHAAGLLLAATFLLSHPIRAQVLKWVAAGATISVAGLVGLQSLNSTPVTFEVIEHTEAADTDRVTEFGAPGASSLDPSASESAGELKQPEATLFEAPKSNVDSQAAELDGQSTQLDSQASSPDAPVVGARGNSRQLGYQLQTWLIAMVHPTLLVGGEVALAEGDEGSAASEAQPDGEAESESNSDERDRDRASPAVSTATKKVLVLNKLELDPKSWPLVGKANAELMFVELFDYTCPHCQRTHVALDGARKKYGDRLAVMTLPVPLDQECNSAVNSTPAAHREACELAKLAIAVWLVDRDAFQEFHEYLFSAKPRYANAVRHAVTLVDNDRLDAMLNGTLPSDYIEKHVALYRRAGAGTIPKLMFPKTTTVGAVESSQAMINLIEQNLGR